MTGGTWSGNWPTVSPQLGATLSGPTDGVLVRMTSSGQLLMSSYVGGGFCDAADTLSIASDGAIYLAGSQSFLQVFPPPATCASSSHGWLVKVNADGTSVAWLQSLAGTDSISGVAAIDGNVWTTGTTRSAALPTTPDAYDSTCGTDGLCNGAWDGFLSIRDSDGNQTYGLLGRLWF